MQSFSQGIGRWSGSAEVFDGTGRFLGNGADVRYVQRLDDGRIRIDVAFIGPFKHAGTYFITDHGDHRRYHGPANIGYAEVFGDSVVDANAYWPALGLSQRFMLFVLPDGNTQLSLALMGRGEQVLYTVVGQNDRVVEDQTPLPTLVSGTAYDLAADPSAGRGGVMVHRAGVWRGIIQGYDQSRQLLGSAEVIEHVHPSSEGLYVKWSGGLIEPAPVSCRLRSNGYLAWSLPEQPMAGSYSLSGGRALSGHFHMLPSGLRCWRRDVVSHNGDIKAVLRFWYRGGERVGVECGFLAFTPAEIGGGHG